MSDEYTKHQLASVLKQLMQSKSINKITITELCYACNIERSTFYYHFQDKYELVMYVFMQIFGEHDPRDKKQTVIGMEKMREDKSFYQNAYRDFPHQMFMRCLQNTYYEIDMDIIKRNLSPAPVPDELKLQLRMWLVGFLQLCMEWMYTERPIPTKEFVDICYDGMPPAVKDALYKE
jgi:AcrR family transcriptional regulator